MCRTALPGTITNPCSSTTLSPVFHRLKETESPINKSQEPTTIDKTNEIINEVSIEETPNVAVSIMKPSPSWNLQCQAETLFDTALAAPSLPFSFEGTIIYTTLIFCLHLFTISVGTFELEVVKIFLEFDFLANALIKFFGLEQKVLISKVVAVSVMKPSMPGWKTLGACRTLFDMASTNTSLYLKLL